MDDTTDAYLARIRADVESDVVIAGDGVKLWAVVSLAGALRWPYEDSPAGEDRPAPVVLYSGLDTREAAEVARREAVEELTDERDGGPYGPSEVPVTSFNALGRALRTLREAGVEHDDLIALAQRVAAAAADCKESVVDDIDEQIPF